MTRAEAITIMNRVLDRRGTEASLTPEYRNGTDNEDPKAWYYYDVIEAMNGEKFAYDFDKYERP